MIDGVLPLPTRPVPDWAALAALLEAGPLNMTCEFRDVRRFLLWLYYRRQRLIYSTVEPGVYRLELGGEVMT